jgi:membrane protein YdbS with pleckstrin-like domain
MGEYDVNRRNRWAAIAGIAVFLAAMIVLVAILTAMST